MIEYKVYLEEKNIAISNKPLHWLEGSFYAEENAKLFQKALQKAYPNRKYIIDKWDTEKNTFIK